MHDKHTKELEINDIDMRDFKLMMESLSLCIILHDAKTKSIVWANPAACRVLGFTLEELLPLKAPDMSRQSHEYRREMGRKWLHGAVLKGINVIEWCYRAKNGDEILSEATATLVHLKQGDVIMVQFRDIAKEEQVRRKMKQLEERLKEFMQDSDEGITVLNNHGAIEYISQSARKLLHINKNEDLPACFTDLCEGESKQELIDLIQLPLPQDISFPIRYTIRLKDGSLCWHEGSCRYIEIEDDLKGYLLHFRDVTLKVQAEMSRRRNQATLEYLARYNAMGEMATAIAHELIQPLAAIRNFLEGTLLRLGQDNASRANIAMGIQHASRQVDHAAAIIKSVREYVVKLEQTESIMNLNELINDVRYFIELKAAENQVKTTFELFNEPLNISCEKVLIGQVILNLAFNAIEEMTQFDIEKRHIVIGSQCDEHRAIVYVRDFGRGIERHHQEKIFDGFFSSKVSGNGIGLTLCKNIITRHRGDIWAQKAKDNGTFFYFALPRLGNDVKEVPPTETTAFPL